MVTRRTVLTGVVVAALFGFTSVAEAADLARFYIVPKVTIQSPIGPVFGPKYINNVDLPGVAWSAIDFGREDTMLVGAAVTPAQHTAIAANADVIAIPSGLDSTINASAITSVRDRLEALKIPVAQLTTANTYRDAVGVVGRMFLLLQRFDGIQGETSRKNFFDLNVTLSSNVNELTQFQRNNLLQAAQSLGLDTSGITGGMTLRVAFRTLIAQMPSFTVMGEAF